MQKMFIQRFITILSDQLYHFRLKYQIFSFELKCYISILRQKALIGALKQDLLRRVIEFGYRLYVMNVSNKSYYNTCFAMKWWITLIYQEFVFENFQFSHRFHDHKSESIRQGIIIFFKSMSSLPILACTENAKVTE